MLGLGAWNEEKGARQMSRKRHTPEQIIQKLRQAEVELSKGATVPQAAKKIGVTEQTYYRVRPPLEWD